MPYQRRNGARRSDFKQSEQLRRIRIGISPTVIGYVRAICAET